MVTSCAGIHDCSHVGMSKQHRQSLVTQSYVTADGRGELPSGDMTAETPQQHRCAFPVAVKKLRPRPDKTIWSTSPTSVSVGALITDASWHTAGSYRRRPQPSPKPRPQSTCKPLLHPVPSCLNCSSWSRDPVSAGAYSGHRTSSSALRSATTCSTTCQLQHTQCTCEAGTHKV